MNYFTVLFCFFQKPSWSPKTLSRRKDVSFVNSGMAGREFMLVERNHFVGATAKYDSEGNIVQLAPDELLPEKYAHL